MDQQFRINVMKSNCNTFQNEIARKESKSLGRDVCLKECQQ